MFRKQGPKKENSNKLQDMATSCSIALALFPRRKLGGNIPCKRRAPVQIDLEALQGLYDMPQPEAARELGIALTTLKQACRKLGIKRWPYARKFPALTETILTDTHRSELDNFCATGSPLSTCSSDCDLANSSDSVKGPSIQDIKDDSSSSVYFDSHLDAGFEDPFDDDCLNKSTPEFIQGWAVPPLVWLTPNKATDMADRSAAFWMIDEPGATLGFLKTVGQQSCYMELSASQSGECKSFCQLVGLR